MKYIAAAVLAVTSFSSVSAQSSTWCGKNFMLNQTVIPPGGQFQLPAYSNEPLVAFRCAPAFRPYLEEDAKDAAFIIDTPIVYQYIQSASLISLPSSGSECDDLGYEITVDISSLPAQKMGYNVTCNATYQAETPSSPTPQYFSTNTSLLYLPDTKGSVVKTDLRTGALWARPADGKGGDFQPFIPQGFYVSFDQYLAKNLSLIDQLKTDGFNTIHPIPPYDNATLFEQVLNRTVELGLYLIYDMRSDYRNLTAVTQQVQAYSSLPNLLLWETAHEPDGNADPFGAARSTYDLIYEMDGYHPISIVLNCEVKCCIAVLRRVQISCSKTHTLSALMRLSRLYGILNAPPTLVTAAVTTVRAAFTISRLASRASRIGLNILGYDRTKTVWSTPQAFGSGAYWNTTPTGPQWAAMGLTSFSHGATGSISFQYPTTTGNTTTIEGTATALTVVIAETVQPFLVDPEVTHETFNVGGVDAGLWDNGTAYLLLVTSFGASNVYVAWADVGLGEVTDGTTQVQQIFSVGQTTNATGLNSGPGGIGVYVAMPPE
ncbi:hypothetical protein JVT61DRAFT_14488 [Boletus reticuloceps]|uniref:Glycoside hydrolase family 5 protein n=1 Tax=Boletus reticuloceps TaxID=495285 RepID=A0A8I2YUQ3_9AGAM|nr:hypothetical protein JVT61DRAFT_14488 [Boletus reticuloceps]